MKYVIIEIVRGNSKERWHSRLKAPNGEIVWFGEKYQNDYSAIELTVRRFIKLLKPNTYKVKIRDGKKVKVVKELSRN